jgi:hypothetical protein
MANITFTASEVRLVNETDLSHQRVYPAGVAITKGQLIKLDSSTGKWALAVAADKATTQLYLSVEGAQVNFPLMGITKGFVDLGMSSNITGLGYGAPIYATATAGVMADTGTVIVGYVAAGTAEAPFGKFLDVALI